MLSYVVGQAVKDGFMVAFLRSWARPRDTAGWRAV